MSNIAAETAQKIHRMLPARGWTETKSGHYQFIEEDGFRQERALQVGYVLGECHVSVNRIDQRGIDYGSIYINRGGGDQFVEEIRLLAEEIEQALRPGQVPTHD